MKPGAIKHASSSKLADKVLRWVNVLYIVPFKPVLTDGFKYQLLRLVQQARLLGEVDLPI